MDVAADLLNTIPTLPASHCCTSAGVRNCPAFLPHHFTHFIDFFDFHIKPLLSYKTSLPNLGAALQKRQEMKNLVKKLGPNAEQTSIFSAKCFLGTGQALANPDIISSYQPAYGLVCEQE